MAAKKIKKTKLSDSMLKSEILAIFNGGITGKMEVYGTLRNKYSIARDRYTGMYDISLLEWGIIKSGVDKVVTVDAAIASANIGVKSKLDKQLHLQKQIDDIQADIDAGITNEYTIIEGKMQKVTKDLNAETKAILRRAIKDIYAELNKMAGDYAPAKLSLTDPDGNVIPRLLSDEQFNQALKAAREDAKTNRS